MRQFLRSKIHRATITQTELHYDGSITIDEDLLDASGIDVHEVVQIVNVNNGERFITYAIAGERGSGIIGLNGAAARRGMPGDLVIIMAFEYVPSAEDRQNIHPTVVKVDEHNRIKST